MDTNALTQQYIDLTREIELHDLQEKEEQMNHNEEVVKKERDFLLMHQSLRGNLQYMRINHM